MLLSEYDIDDFPEEERPDGCTFSDKASAFGFGFLAGVIVASASAAFVLAFVIVPAILASHWLR